MSSISDLIGAALDSGKTVRDLERDSGYRVKYQTFQDLSKHRPKEFPRNRKTMVGMAQALRVSETAIVLAYAKGIGHNVDADSSFALRLPVGIDGIDVAMQNALIAVARAAVNMSSSSSSPGTRPVVARDKSKHSAWVARTPPTPRKSGVLGDENGGDRNLGGGR